MSKQDKIVLEDYQHARECLWSGEYERAGKIYEECSRYFIETGDVAMYAKSQISLGITFEEMGSRDMAMDCYLQGLRYVRANGLDAYEGVFYQSIGNCFLVLEDYQRAAKYFELGGQILEDAKNYTDIYEKWLAVSYLNLGAAYLKLGEYDKSEEVFLKGLAKAREVGNTYYEETIIVELCRIRCKRGDTKFFEENREYLISGLRTEDETPTDLFFTVSEMLALLKETACYDEMYKVLTDFENIIVSIDLPSMRVKLYELYMDYYKTVGDGENYKKVCVKHARYCKILSDKERLERIRAINVKIDYEEAKSSIISANSISGVDGLTGLKNRHALNTDAKRIIAECDDTKEALLVMIIDIDCFKGYNDTYGHIKGDEILVEISDIISSAIKDIGYAYRFGGDEFVVIVKNPLKNVGDRIATELRSHLHHLNIKNEASTVRSELTISIGGYLAKEPWKYSFDELLNNADDALYVVKESGRNDYRIVNS